MAMQNTERLSASRLLAYAAPTVALQAMLVPLYNFLPPVYYAPKVGLSVALVGLMFLLGRVWEAVTDPLVGAWSDRTRSTFGRRRIWMLAGAPIALGATYFLLNPPGGSTWGYLLLWLMIFYIGWSMVFIPHQTWGTELATDYDERTRIAGFRETGAFVGYLCATIVPLIYWTAIAGVSFPSFAQIVQAVGVFFVIALPVAIIWCFVAVPNVAQAAGEATPSWGQMFAILGRNKPFLRLISAYLIDRLAMGTYFAVMPPLVTQAYGIGKDLLWVALGNTVAAVVLSPIWVPLARRLGKHRAYCLANGLTLLSYLSLFFLPAGQLWPVLLANFVMAAGNGGTMILPPAMAADTVDNDELVSGFNQPGGHMAFLAFVFKAGMGLGAAVGLGFIGLYGYHDSAQLLTASVSQGVRISASLVPAALLVIPILMMWRYPIDNRRHAQIRRELEQKRGGVPAKRLAVQTGQDLRRLSTRDGQAG